MAELPKIVRDRLKAMPAAAHPDADLLTAFAEKVLGERERAQVLEHLAQCSACREVVSLALPQEEEEEAAAAPLRARGWVLRWESAAALAAVVVAAVALLLIPNSMFKSGRSTMPSVAQAPEPGKTEQAAEKPASGNETATREEARNAPAPAEVPGKKAAKAKSGAGGGVVGGTMAGLAEADKDRRDQTKAALAKTPAIAATSGTVAAMDAAAPRTAEKKQMEAAAEQQAAAGQAVTGGAAADRALQVPAVTPPARAKEDFKALSSAPASKWRTTAAGKLEHSTDSGENYHAVNVAPGAVLNAVSAVGEHVWSGGHRQGVAVLYYSGDEGKHWARLDFAGPAPAADIVALNFTDPQHGAMTVILAEDPTLRQIWRSGDGGRTWAAPAR